MSFLKKSVSKNLKSLNSYLLPSDSGYFDSDFVNIALGMASAVIFKDGTILRYNDLLPTWISIESNFFETLVKDDEDTFRLALTSASSTPLQTQFRIFSSSASKIMWISCTVRACDFDTYQLGLHDVSQWCERITQLETELKEKESRLEFVEKERYQRNVLAISHEIRTQLNGIIGPCSLLCDTELTEHQGELVSSIAECSDNLNQIVNDILDFSKLSSEGFSLDNRPFCLKRTVESVMLSYQVRASKKNLQLSFHFEKNSPTFILGDIGRLKQVFHNLLGNAVKFTNQGSISLSVASKSLGNNKYEIEVKISDTGIGMKQEDMNEIFEPFKQGDTPQKNNGTGLGLAISKAIIEQMGGKIWCESRFGVGTNFIFTFITEECYGACCGRTHVPNFASHQSKKSRLNFYTPNSFTNITLDPEDRNFPLNILIADDNEINVMVSLKVLEKLGFKADVATNGLEAVKAVKNKSYDLILMDIKMPEMDGFTASRTIRNDSSVKVQPIIIALTANTFQTDSEKCVEAGMNGKIVKPLVNNELVATIRSVINGVRARGSGRADSPCSTIQSFSS